ncbi:zinc finger protein GAI-ASSOCIATED FACTOR 1-like [Typha latifolia]|uniref:zinc finger protein GAI-ASSOCIATED FACTOR 1-like n=1 Tax=Typha latifolia TaxID=4733 RepID=UPI003C2C1C9E
MPMELENSSVMTVSNSASGEASVSSSGQPAAAPPVPTPKKKRNLPGMPDPDAEVIALSPKTLMATNRFVCEICNKGFQRDQNLQLHRRGHNLPWKLRQRTGKEVRKRVYVCPEPSCVHHEPSRALGDLTGIKKHFCRKHGEKKWKCDKCSKKYAVQSDWKAHSKTCGTREYRCDCGTLFSRRDSFITHRAFCDALAEESAKNQAAPPAAPPPIPPPEEGKPPPPPPVPAAVATALPQEEPENPTGLLQYMPPPSIAISNTNNSNPTTTTTTSSSNSSSSSSSTTTTTATTTSLFASLFATASAPGVASQSTTFSDLIGAMGRTSRTLGVEPPSLCLSTNGPNSLFLQPAADRHQFAPPPPSPHLSATALLQKASQMGVTSSSSSFLRGFGLATPSCSSGQHQESIQDNNMQQWHHQLEPEQAPILSAGLGLGLPYGSSGAAGLPDLMMGPSSIFVPKPATLDFLGLGMGPVGASATGGLSALITSIGGGIDMGGPGAGPGAVNAGPFGTGSSPRKAWEGAERKPNRPAFL